MADQFSRSLLKVAIAQICQGLGWHAMQSTPCDILVDIMQRYIEKTGRISSQYAAQFGRTFVNLNDLALAFEDMGVNLYEFENYVHAVEPMPFVHDVPSFPIPKKNNLQHPPSGSRHCRERLASIPEYMPPLVGVKEDFTPIHDRRDSLFSSLSMDTDSPELLSPTGQDSLEKRGEKRSPDYVDHSIKRFRLDSEGNLQEVVIGAVEDSNKRRVGKLPEAVTPPRRTSVMIPESHQKSAVTQALSMAGNTTKSKSPKQQKYGTQETKAPKMRLPVSTSSSKGPIKPQSKSPKHHLFNPNGPSKYPVKVKTPVNVGVIPQPNQAVEFKPAKGSKSQRASGGAISTLLSAALQIQDDENKSTVPPPKKKDEAMSIYDFDDDTEGKGKENMAAKEASSEGLKSPITSGESKADPNSPRVYDEYEIVRTTYPTEEDPKKEVKKKEKGKVRKKKEKVKQKDKKKAKVIIDQPLFLPDAKVKAKANPAKVKKAEEFPEPDAPPAKYASYVPPKKGRPPKLDISKFVKKEPAEEEIEPTPKIVIKTLVKEQNVGKKPNRSPITLKKTKKLEKWKKKKFKKDRYKVTLGFPTEKTGKTLTSKFGSPSKLSKEKPVKKLNIIKTNSSNPFQIKISSPKVELPEPEVPVVKEKTKKKKKIKIKEEKKAIKDETSTSKSTTKEKEQKAPKSETSSGSSVPKITLKMGGNTGDGKFVIKTIRPPSPSSDKDSPPSSPIPLPPVPKISIPVLPAKKSTKPSTPKTPKATVKKPLKVKESSVFVDSLPPPTKPRQKNTSGGKGSSKTAKSKTVDVPVSPKGRAGRVLNAYSRGKKTGTNKSSPKNSSVSPTGAKSSSASKEKASAGSKVSPTSKSGKAKGTGNPPEGHLVNLVVKCLFLLRLKSRNHQPRNRQRNQQRKRK
ncbi:putative transcription initiation factor TFIID subunit 3 isoform X2 [Apostichopus japonicus]|uniref:Putative transcription initiation factor TFIID subunit 3 isoform X2 n=1 Tax=Stichopus japonicus TaxID=307972 RepID=A0A2G8KHH4_STIJA|nr:putative transcription initiation factor TFIID subunit 3 isoform X2 [Apostichopus japonicus]